MEADQFPLNGLKEKDQRRRRRKRGIFDEDEEESEGDFSHKRKKRQAPYLIFPEILCIIDYDGYRYDDFLFNINFLKTFLNFMKLVNCNHLLIFHKFIGSMAKTILPLNVT